MQIYVNIYIILYHLSYLNNHIYILYILSRYVLEYLVAFVYLCNLSLYVCIYVYMYAYTYIYMYIFIVYVHRCIQISSIQTCLPMLFVFCVYPNIHPSVWGEQFWDRCGRGSVDYMSSHAEFPLYQIQPETPKHR